ncbi:MAG: serine hydrolase domain-containing protein [Meiothermus sp.]|nr:serine hydrolase domain-containing protein [Meiothermus sp.]
MLRFALLTVVLHCAAVAQTCVSAPPFALGGRPVTGYGGGALEPFDRVMARVLGRYKIPGAALAVAKDGRLVLSRGYGWADVAARQRVAPDALFRLASLSKPITAVAVLHLGEGLVAQGVYPNLESFLGEKALNLAGVTPFGGRLNDPRVRNITVRDLLQHSGGWNRNLAGDLPFRPTLTRVAKATGMPESMSPRALVAFGLSRRLNFAPGTRSVYSNVGYLALGRVIERVSGKGYGEYVQGMMADLGITEVGLARTALQLRQPGEVRYYDWAGAPPVKSIVDGSQTSRPYGEIYLEQLDAAGGLLASAPALVHFVASLEGLRSEVAPPVSREALEVMLHRPALPAYANSSRYYALGWGVRVPQAEVKAMLAESQHGNGTATPAAPRRLQPQQIVGRMNQLGVGGLEWSHDGTFAGTRTLLLRLSNGATIAALFNSRPYYDWRFIAELRQSLENAASAVVGWPEYDCF